MFLLTGKAGGPADAQLMLGGTLPFHVTGIYADRAPHPGGTDGFVVEVAGTPGLSRVGEWNSVRIAPDGALEAVAALRRSNSEEDGITRRVVAMNPDPYVNPGPSGGFVPFALAETEQSIPARFEQQARRHPERIAVRTRSRSLGPSAR